MSVIDASGWDDRNDVLEIAAAERQGSVIDLDDRLALPAPPSSCGAPLCAPQASTAIASM